jgi:hypothetical protein
MSDAPIFEGYQQYSIDKYLESLLEPEPTSIDPQHTVLTHMPATTDLFHTAQLQQPIMSAYCIDSLGHIIPVMSEPHLESSGICGYPNLYFLGFLMGQDTKPLFVSLIISAAHN